MSENVRIFQVYRDMHMTIVFFQVKILFSCILYSDFFSF